jgi:hypothetical protein
METKYYIDSAGNYIGAFCGNHGINISMYIEVPYGPEKASNIWDGVQWT